MKLIGSIISVFLFTDMSIYWIHRLLHYKWVYKVIVFFINARVKSGVHLFLLVHPQAPPQVEGVDSVR